MCKRYLKQNKILNLILSLCFVLNTFSSSALGALAPTAPAYNLQLPLLRYLSINSANPYNYFNFLLDKGLSPQGTDPNLTQEAKKLINYFFLGISLSNEAFWVNLQPKDAEKMTSGELGRTDMGRVLLEQDLQLKKDVAKYLHPDNTFGKIFWERLYTEIGKDKVRREKITTSQRVWIVPDTATVVETADGAFISEAKLKVLLENEYLKAQKGLSPSKLSQSELKGTVPMSAAEQQIQLISERLMKEIIIPELTFDVNHSSLYAPLRQIYYSLILAEYFKRKQAQKGLSPQMSNPTETKGTVPKDSDPYISLINQNTTLGLESELPWSKDKIFQEYLTSYQKGEYQIKRSLLGLARMYFSGGITLAIPPAGATDLGMGGGVIKTISAGSPLNNVYRPTPEEDNFILMMKTNGQNDNPFAGDINVLGGEPETTGEERQQAGSPVEVQMEDIKFYFTYAELTEIDKPAINLLLQKVRDNIAAQLGSTGTITERSIEIGEIRKRKVYFVAGLVGENRGIGSLDIDFLDKLGIAHGMWQFCAFKFSIVGQTSKRGVAGSQNKTSGGESASPLMGLRGVTDETKTLPRASEAEHGEVARQAGPRDDELYGGIDLNAIKMELKNYASSPLEEKKELIGKLKTLLCIDALLDKKWFSLSHLYFQEIIHLVKDKLVSELDRDKLLIAATALKAKGYLIDRQGLEFLKLLEAGKPIAEIRFLLSP